MPELPQLQPERYDRGHSRWSVAAIVLIYTQLWKPRLRQIWCDRGQTQFSLGTIL